MQCPAKKFRLCYSSTKQNALLVNCPSGWNAHVWIACVAWRFWLLSNKGGRGQKNREEIGAGATEEPFSRGFAARSRALRARISRLRRSCARLNKTAMLRRLMYELCCLYSDYSTLYFYLISVFFILYCILFKNDSLLRILRFPGYFETPLFRTFFLFLWDFEIAGLDCS